MLRSSAVAEKPCIFRNYCANTVPWSHLNLHPERHLNPFNRFSTARGYVRRTDRHTHHGKIGNNRLHLCTTCMRCGLIISPSGGMSTMNVSPRLQDLAQNLHICRLGCRQTKMQNHEERFFCDISVRIFTTPAPPEVRHINSERNSWADLSAWGRPHAACSQSM